MDSLPARGAEYAYLLLPLKAHRPPRVGSPEVIMSWQLLVPIVEKLIDVGVEYYKSDSQTMGTVAATGVAAPANTGASILLAVESSNPGGALTKEAIKTALEDMASRHGIKLTAVDIKVP